MRAQMFKEPRNVILSGAEQQAMPAFEELGERAQIAEIGLAGEWPKAFFHAQIDLIVLEKREIGGRAHITDYGLRATSAAGGEQVTEPHSSRNQGLQ